MKKLVAKIIHWVDPEFFTGRSYSYLERWGIEDVYQDKLIWKDETT